MAKYPPKFEHLLDSSGSTSEWPGGPPLNRIEKKAENLWENVELSRRSARRGRTLAPRSRPGWREVLSMTQDGHLALSDFHFFQLVDFSLLRSG